MSKGVEDDSAGRSDRRADERQLAVLRVAKLITERGEQLCRLRNISAHGVMAEVQGVWWPGEPAAVQLKSGNAVPGRVAWAKDGRIGIAFDHEIAPQDILAADAGQPQRLLRVAVSAEASLCLGGAFHMVQVEDISLGGMRIALDGEDLVDRKIFVTLDGLPTIGGVIRWQNDGHAGIAFTEYLELDALAYWLASRA